MRGKVRSLLKALLRASRTDSDERTARKISSLAAARGETEEQTRVFLRRLLPRFIPKRVISPDRFSDLPIVETGLDGTLAYVRLENGRTLFSYPSSPMRLRQYWVIRDKLPRTIRPEAFSAVFDVARRYINADVSEIDRLVGGNIIEAGAYIGHKAMRFADELGPQGRVIAVEIDESNCQIMRRNIEVNSLQDQIIAVNAGLWSSAGHFVSISNNYQRNSLAQVDKIDGNRTREVECTTLDALIEEYGLNTVEYINIQVNGAELEVLKGCAQSLGRIRRLGINSKYMVDDQPVRPLVVEWLKEHGLNVRYKGGSKKRIVADRSVGL